MNRPRRSSAALGRLVVAAIAAIGGLAVASSGVALAAALTHHTRIAPKPRQALPAAHQVASAAMVVTSQRLGQVLQSDYPRTYGGVAIRGGGEKITVYMTRMPHGLAHVVDAVAPARDVAYGRSAHSLATLLRIHRQLAGDWMSLEAQGIDIVGFDPDVVSSTEQIQVIGPTLSQVATIVGVFGLHAVSIKSVGGPPIPAGFTQRIEAETHGVVPPGALPIIAGFEAVLLALVAAVVVRARRRTQAPAG